MREDTVVPVLVLLWHSAIPSWLHPGVPACSSLFNPGPASPIPSTAESRSGLGGAHPITRAWGTQGQGGICLSRTLGDAGRITLPPSKASCAQLRVLGVPGGLDGTLSTGEPGQPHPGDPQDLMLNEQKIIGCIKIMQEPGKGWGGGGCHLQSEVGSSPCLFQHCQRSKGREAAAMEGGELRRVFLQPHSGNRNLLGWESLSIPVRVDPNTAVSPSRRCQHRGDTLGVPHAGGLTFLHRDKAVTAALGAPPPSSPSAPSTVLVGGSTGSPSPRCPLELGGSQ